MYTGGGWAEFRVPSLSTQLDRKSTKHFAAVQSNDQYADRGRFACSKCPQSLVHFEYWTKLLEHIVTHNLGITLIIKLNAFKHHNRVPDILLILHICKQMRKCVFIFSELSRKNGLVQPKPEN